MIGHLGRACTLGRRHARAGIRNPTVVPKDTLTRSVYIDAWRRERAAMERAGRLPQTELPLQTATAGVADSACTVEHE